MRGDVRTALEGSATRTSAQPRVNGWVMDGHNVVRFLVEGRELQHCPKTTLHRCDLEKVNHLKEKIEQPPTGLSRLPSFPIHTNLV